MLQYENDEFITDQVYYFSVKFTFFFLYLCILLSVSVISFIQLSLTPGQCRIEYSPSASSGEPSHSHTQFKYKYLFINPVLKPFLNALNDLIRKTSGMWQILNDLYVHITLLVEQCSIFLHQHRRIISTRLTWICQKLCDSSIQLNLRRILYAKFTQIMAMLKC